MRAWSENLQSQVLTVNNREKEDQENAGIDMLKTPLTGGFRPARCRPRETAWFLWKPLSSHQ